MREPNQGIMMNCVICGKHFWCDDGDPFCSGDCYDYDQECRRDFDHPGYGEEE
ncbi:hypothetical protein V7124_19545 [Neobacillus niacini]|uniref:hypothetical protein n=1 Tax=Neobacillus niacini TaxID=86668 RepID=UPI002FFD9090